MTATYDPALSEPKDQIRLLLGDRDVTNAKLSDEEINASLGLYTSVYATAAALADGLAAQYSALPNISIDGASFSNGDRAAAYRVLASRLREQAVMAAPGGLGAPFVGGVSRSDVKSNDDNCDRTPSIFEVGMMDDHQTPGARDWRDLE